MKLFYWNEIAIWSNWFPGTAYAYAETKERAIELIVCRFRDDLVRGHSTKDSVQEHTDNLQKGLQNTEPQVFDNEEVGFYNEAPE